MFPYTVSFRRCTWFCRLSKNYWRLSLRHKPHAKHEGRVLTQTQTSRPLLNTEVAFPISDANLVPNARVAFQLKRGCHTSSTTDARVAFCVKSDGRTAPQNTSLWAPLLQLNTRACELCVSTQHSSLCAPHFFIRARSTSNTRFAFLL